MAGFSMYASSDGVASHVQLGAHPALILPHHDICRDYWQLKLHSEVLGFGPSIYHLVLRHKANNTPSSALFNSYLS